MHTLVGNEPVKKRLLRLIEQNRVPHLLLFSGPEGIGKKQFALWFSRQYVAHLAVKPLSDAYPDIFCIVPEGKSGMHSIQSIRRAQEEIALAPFEAPAKVLIIDDAERMLPPSANALLKTLEEPPSHALIILVSSAKNRLLPTILSRCQEVRFAPCSREEIVSVLRNHLPEQDLLHIADSARGSDDIQTTLFEFLQSQGWRSFHRVSQFAGQLQLLLEHKKKERSEALWLHVKEEMKEYTSTQKHMVEQEIEGALQLLWMQEIRALFRDIMAYFRDQNAGALSCEVKSLFTIAGQKPIQQASLPFSDETLSSAVQKSLLLIERQTPLQNVLETLFVKLGQ